MRVRRINVDSEVFILDTSMVDGAIDQTGEGKKKTSLMGCYRLNCILSKFTLKSYHHPPPSVFKMYPCLEMSL